MILVIYCNKVAINDTVQSFELDAKWWGIK
jgi:hypothetical protein